VLNCKVSQINCSFDFDFRSSLDNLIRRADNKENLLLTLKTELDNRIQVRGGGRQQGEPASQPQDRARQPNTGKRKRADSNFLLTLKRKLDNTDTGKRKRAYNNFLLTLKTELEKRIQTRGGGQTARYFCKKCRFRNSRNI